MIYKPDFVKVSILINESGVHDYYKIKAKNP